MANSRGGRARGSRGRARGRGRAIGGRGDSRRRGSAGRDREPHSPGPPQSLIVTLHVRAPPHLGQAHAQQPHQLPTPESSTVSRSGAATPSPQRQSVEPVRRRGRKKKEKQQEAEREEPMAPVRDPNDVEALIKDVIQHLFEVQSAVHGYLPETQGPLVDKITDLTHSLAALKQLATSPHSSVAGVELPPEILDYVDGGRNPDVYTREFVELVQRGNAVLNGKQEAFKGFSEVFAQELVSAMPETRGGVEMVMQSAGLKIRGEEEDGKAVIEGGERRQTEGPAAEAVRRGNGSGNGA